MSRPSATHLVLIPSYNGGSLLGPTVAAAASAWNPVRVVVDGSTDGSERAIDPATPVRIRAQRGGKGAAVRDGLAWAADDGFTHALVMDGDAQHPACRIPEFMAASAARPAAMILGVPQFGPDAPRIRVLGRRLANWCAARQTGGQIADALFGFRVYPIAPLLRILREAPYISGYEFDAEAAIRLCWAGHPAENRPAPVRYPDDGISHYRYGQDNLRLVAAYARLSLALLLMSAPVNLPEVRRP